MQYDFIQSNIILERTPKVIRALLLGLPPDWLMTNEGPDTFSPFDVLGHLVHGEKTDWPARVKLILESGDSLPFAKFDRFAMYEESKGKCIDDLLDDFDQLRKTNLAWLNSLVLTKDDLLKPGLHPVLGPVSLENLLSTWVVHDLTHLAQICRVMAKQYKDAVGPWQEFFRLLNF